MRANFKKHFIIFPVSEIRCDYGLSGKIRINRARDDGTGHLDRMNYGFCDLTEAKGSVLLQSEKIVHVPRNRYIPSHYFQTYSRLSN